MGSGLRTVRLGGLDTTESRGQSIEKSPGDLGDAVTCRGPYEYNDSNGSQ